MLPKPTFRCNCSLPYKHPGIGGLAAVWNSFTTESINVCNRRLLVIVLLDLIVLKLLYTPTAKKQTCIIYDKTNAYHLTEQTR